MDVKNVLKQKGKLAGVALAVLVMSLWFVSSSWAGKPDRHWGHCPKGYHLRHHHGFHPRHNFHHHIHHHYQGGHSFHHHRDHYYHYRNRLHHHRHYRDHRCFRGKDGYYWHTNMIFGIPYSRSTGCFMFRGCF